MRRYLVVCLVLVSYPTVVMADELRLLVDHEEIPCGSHISGYIDCAYVFEQDTDIYDYYLTAIVESGGEIDHIYVKEQGFANGRGQPLSSGKTLNFKHLLFLLKEDGKLLFEEPGDYTVSVKVTLSPSDLMAPQFTNAVSISVKEGELAPDYIKLTRRSETVVRAFSDWNLDARIGNGYAKTARSKLLEEYLLYQGTGSFHLLAYVYGEREKLTAGRGLEYLARWGGSRCELGGLIGEIWAAALDVSNGRLEKAADLKNVLLKPY